MSNKLYYRDKKFWTIARNVAIGLMLLGFVLLAAFLLFPEPHYEDLQKDTIVIQSYTYIPYARGPDVFWLFTDQNQTYRICKKGTEAMLRSELKVGVVANIKYYTNKFFRTNDIQEMIVNGQLLVPYKDYRKSDLITIIVVVTIQELSGVGILWVGIAYKKSSHYTKEKTKEIKERARLKK